MGKLRKLRKAILKDPDRWRSKFPFGRRVAHGARFCKRDGWVRNIWGHSYEAFVAHVLREVGNADVRA